MNWLAVVAVKKSERDISVTVTTESFRSFPVAQRRGIEEEADA